MKKASEGGGRELILETGDYCFLCLHNISTKQWTGSEEAGSFGKNKVHSFQHPSHYLKMDKRKVFNESVPVPEHLLEKVEKSELKIELCEGCAEVNKRFSDYCQKLEKIKMEIGNCVRNFHEKLTKTEETGRSEMFRMFSKQKGMDLEKVNMVRRLRAELFQKCESNLDLSLPRVALNSSSPEVSTVSDVESLPIRIDKVFSVQQTPSHSMESAVGTTKGRRDLVTYRFEDFPPPLSPQVELTSSSSSSLTQGSQQKQTIKINIVKKSKPDSVSKDKEKGRFVCQHCSKSFSNNGNLTRHIQGVHLKIRFNCHLCNESFPQDYHLKLHLKNVHSNSSSKYKCGKCQRSFISSVGLQRHKLKGYCSSSTTNTGETEPNCERKVIVTIKKAVKADIVKTQICKVEQKQIAEEAEDEVDNRDPLQEDLN